MKLFKKYMGENGFKKLSKFPSFLLSKFTLTRSNEGKMNSVRFDMTYSLESKFLTKDFGQTYL